jgi:hypothetical protein
LARLVVSRGKENDGGKRPTLFIQFYSCSVQVRTSTVLVTGTGTPYSLSSCTVRVQVYNGNRSKITIENMNPYRSSELTDDDRVRSRMIRGKALTRIGIGIAIASVPVGIWWQWAIGERKKAQNEFTIAKERREQLPPALRSQDTFETILANKCLPGDVILFDRRPERCCSSPWSALSCVISRSILCNIGGDKGKFVRTVDGGSYDHIGLVVPGFVQKRSDEYDPSNLLVLEATPSGIVARNLRDRIEQSASRSVILLQLCCPGEERNVVGINTFMDTNKRREMESRELTVHKTRQHLDKELCRFRDMWIQTGQTNNYEYIHSTIAIGGAIAYALGMSDVVAGPVSPSAYLVLYGLQKAFAAPSYNEVENRRIKVEDFLRNYRMVESDAVRLRPGWRFLAPIPLKDK